ncbi:MAG: CysS/YqeB C-terminal domain-containing protein, partial [Alphaproteobacteria bacterium]
FPHHENEIAQSCCANDTDQMANYWMHNGYVTVNGEKMSKSLGNFFTPHQLLEEGHTGEAIRMTLLSGHYRAPLDFNNTKLGEAKTQLDRMYRVVADATGEGKVDARFLEALSDDINTPQAIAVLHELAGEGNGADLKASAELLGLLLQDAEQWFKGPASDEDAEIDALVAARDQARADKNWAEADRLRDKLTEMGIVMEDAAGKTGWRRV